MTDEHYIIVRVRERRGGDPKQRREVGSLDAGVIRRAIHSVADEYEMNVSDILIRGDRTVNYYGQPEPWDAVKRIFDHVMNTAKNTHAERLRSGWYVRNQLRLRKRKS